MREYEQLGHMTLVPADELNFPSYHIPHRAVVRPNALTTRVRVVFNASSSCGEGYSLNEACLNGPVVQPDLFDTLLRFRTYPIAFCADIQQMYRRVLIQECDRDLQRIFWRESRDEPVREYRLNTVTYGVKPASFMATKCISILADELSIQNPQTADFIKKSFYMDDLLAGAENVSEAITLQKVIHDTLLSAGFKLRKYVSNCPELLETLQNEYVNPEPKFINDSAETSVLGIGWKTNSEDDQFIIKIDLQSDLEPSALSKRIMLSEISRIFDPLGFLSPVTIKGKIFMQELWRQELKWDSVISEELAAEFLAYRTSLKKLSNFSIPRFAGCNEQNSELIGFCDASATAYCAAVYCRWSKNGVTDCILLCSKTRVAPIKQLTIPKLELEAALLLAKLMNRICDLLRGKFNGVTCFSDAKVVLSWLNKPPEKWQPFVSNRVRKITNFVPRQYWFYVSTKENPADLATRGISAEAFIGEAGKIGSSGPSFLFQEEELESKRTPLQFVKGCFQIHHDSPPLKEKSMKDIIESFSSHERLISTFARILLRFSKNRPESLLSARSRALTCIIKILQTAYFNFEVAAAGKGKLSDLLPFLDADGVIRVGGRLENSSYSYDFRHPIILPGASNFVESYIRHLHKKFYHAGCSFLVSFVASKYRVISNLYKIVKKVVYKCTRCIRHRAQTAQQLMGQLPISRITLNRPFSTVGTDLAGPFSVKCTRHRPSKPVKMYAAFFVCFCTRAIHIELLSELSAESYILTLRRFVSRRGLPQTIYSDNATNFQACSKYVSGINPILEEYAAKGGIHWVFIPPNTPHQGGMHEAAVKSAKRLLLRSFNGAVLTQEELCTAFSEIEAILNSRPLCYDKKPDNSTFILTPGHFLIGKELVGLPEPANAEKTPVKLSARYEDLRNRINSFGKQWRANYLSQMQTRNKWRKPSKNIAVGDVVLIKERDSHVTAWPYGLVNQIHSDSQGYVREVDVLTKGFLRRRGITNLIPLISSDEPEVHPRGSLNGDEEHARAED